MRRLLALGLLLGLVSAAGAQLSLPRAPATLAFTPITVLPMATRAAGTYSFGSVAVPTGVIGAGVSMDITQATDPLPGITVIVEGSLDGGATWQSVGSYTRAAGPKGTDKNGVTNTVVAAGFTGGAFWSAASNANRQLRGVATLTVNALRSALIVQPL